MSDRSAHAETVEHFDVLVVGAGISGINAAYHLKDQIPEASFVVLETFESFGGTWLSHKFPGIRSDSDLFTFGYRFKPWIGPPIATAEEILAYMGEVIDENDLADHIRYRHRISQASWSSKDSKWSIIATNLETDEEKHFTTGFLYMAQGYFRHGEGYWPDWPGMDQYKGQLVHSEEWSEDIDYAGKQVLVIGSGATAATLVPNMSDTAEHVTMLQRSPSFYFLGSNTHEIVDKFRKMEADDDWIHTIMRKQILFELSQFTNRSFSEPEKVKEELISVLRPLLGPDYDIETHFTPNYRPWRQRIALVPKGDLFESISSGKASVETDQIERFVEGGVLLKSGRELSADLIVAATGFNMNVLGDIEFAVDGKPVNFHDSLTYRGMMFTGLPNLVWVFGYFRASWTLRAELVADFVCRLWRHMKETGATEVTVAPKPDDADMAVGNWVNDENFNPHYMTRSLHVLPKSGAKPEWQHSQDYLQDLEEFPDIDISGPEFTYSGHNVSSAPGDVEQSDRTGAISK